MIGLGHCCGRKGKGLASGSPSRFSKLFGRSSLTYERVATDGGESGTGFELAAYDSDEEVQGHASGWATPKVVAVGTSEALGSPGKRPVLGDGIIARTDSRDNLTAAKLEARMNRSRSPAVRFGSALSRTTSTN